jgi:hypothetical protein
MMYPYLNEAIEKFVNLCDEAGISATDETCRHEHAASDYQGTVECLACKETLIDMSGATEGDR